MPHIHYAPWIAHRPHVLPTTAGCWRTQPDEPGANSFTKAAAFLVTALLWWLLGGHIAAGLRRLLLAARHAAAPAAAALGSGAAAVAAALGRLMAGSPLAGIIAAALAGVGLAVGGIVAARAVGLLGRRQAWTLLMQENASNTEAACSAEDDEEYGLY